MKTSIIRYIFFFMAVQFFCTSCEKLIEVQMPDNQINTKQVFEDVQTANAALAGLYAGLWDNSPLSGDQSGKLLGSYTDDLNCYAVTATNGAYDIYINQQVDTNTAIYSYWSSAYEKIYAANSIIEGAEHSSLPSVEKNRIKREALLVRSMLYFYLQQMFGDIPYVVSTDYQLNRTLSKTSASEISARLEIDLSQAISWLVDDYRNPERIFPNRKVGQLLLAKVYMTEGKWSDAEIVLKGIVQSPLYQFENDITKVFTKSEKHILWQLKPKNSGDPTKEVILYYFSNALPNNYAVSEDLMNSFSGNDLRKLNWITPVTVNGNTWYRVDKYKNRIINNTEYSVIIRLEEVYFLLAESLVQQNKLQEALPYINPTRVRAGLSTLSNQLSKAQLIDEILLERRKEFFAEMGHRFLDLKRLGRLHTLLTVKQNWKDTYQRWPIPQNELLSNQHLNPQNAGY
ncbi:RagB/SusD family nutrient uptake outer membrane protein [Chryseobacterium sp. ERMR1:04]|uniref:RagB/SusD family nutrient uptake outer membrane protein n=1 Tax=Chryseobacterium sp. ERMR1:04 TaxID=1705393 RepID=UPI0006CC5D59|nr:RagB/SusD family nutrient uptake outer membrane protein [Chryseobacterium sp. ERMR1:04]KPH14798.1 glycan metabolism protein RagB [Chryseobacterium sp. ERMR1:04]